MPPHTQSLDLSFNLSSVYYLSIPLCPLSFLLIASPFPFPVGLESPSIIVFPSWPRAGQETMLKQSEFLTCPDFVNSSQVGNTSQNSSLESAVWLTRGKRTSLPMPL